MDLLYSIQKYIDDIINGIFNLLQCLGSIYCSLGGIALFIFYYARQIKFVWCYTFLVYIFSYAGYISMNTTNAIWIGRWMYYNHHEYGSSFPTVPKVVGIV